MITTPSRVIVSMSPFYEEFVTSPGVYNDIRVYSEITRQIFDIIDNKFEVFVRFLDDLPRLTLLVNSEYLINNPSTLALLRENIKAFGLGAYFNLMSNGVIHNQGFPYLLETVQNDLCILFLTEDTVFDNLV